MYPCHILFLLFSCTSDETALVHLVHLSWTCWPNLHGKCWSWTCWLTLHGKCWSWTCWPTLHGKCWSWTCWPTLHSGPCSGRSFACRKQPVIIIIIVLFFGVFSCASFNLYIFLVLLLEKFRYSKILSSLSALSWRWLLLALTPGVVVYCGVDDCYSGDTRCGCVLWWWWLLQAQTPGVVATPEGCLWCTPCVVWHSTGWWSLPGLTEQQPRHHTSSLPSPQHQPVWWAGILRNTKIIKHWY